MENINKLLTSAVYEALQENLVGAYPVGIRHHSGSYTIGICSHVGNTIGMVNCIGNAVRFTSYVVPFEPKSYSASADFIQELTNYITEVVSAV